LPRHLQLSPAHTITQNIHPTSRTPLPPTSSSFLLFSCATASDFFFCAAVAASCSVFKSRRALSKPCSSHKLQKHFQLFFETQDLLQSLEPRDCGVHFSFCRRQLRFSRGNSFLSRLFARCYTFAFGVAAAGRGPHLFSLRTKRFKPGSFSCDAGGFGLQRQQN
jgi:hypothetical protein